MIWSVFGTLRKSGCTILVVKLISQPVGDSTALDRKTARKLSLMALVNMLPYLGMTSAFIIRVSGYGYPIGYGVFFTCSALYGSITPYLLLMSSSLVCDKSYG